MSGTSQNTPREVALAGQSAPEAADQVSPRPRGRPTKRMPSARRATSKCHGRAAIGRRANTLRPALRKLCGDIKECEQHSNQPSKEPARQSRSQLGDGGSAAARAAAKNVSSWPESQKPSAGKREMSTKSNLKDASLGPPQVCALGEPQKPWNPFRASSLSQSRDGNVYGVPNKPQDRKTRLANENSGAASRHTGAPNQQAARTSLTPRAPAAPETTTGINSTPTAHLPTGNQHPTNRQTPTPAPNNWNNITNRPTQPNNNNNNNNNNARQTRHTHPRATPTPTPVPNTLAPPITPVPAPHNLRYTSLRLALITEAVQLTPGGTNLLVNARPEGVEQTPEALLGPPH